MYSTVQYTDNSFLMLTRIMLVYYYTGEVVKGVWLHMYYACVLLYRRGSEGGVASHVLCLCITIQAR